MPGKKVSVAEKADTSRKRRGASNYSDQPGTEAQVLDECKLGAGMTKSPESGKDL